MLNTELIWRRGNYLKYEKLSLPFDSVEKTLLFGLFNNFPTKENLQNIEIGNYQQVLLPLKKYLYSLIDQKLKTTKFKNLFIDISSVTQNLTNTIHLNLIDNILFTTLEYEREKLKTGGLLQGTDLECHQQFIEHFSQNLEWIEYYFEEYPVLFFRVELFCKHNLPIFLSF